MLSVSVRSFAHTLLFNFTSFVYKRLSKLNEVVLEKEKGELLFRLVLHGNSCSQSVQGTSHYTPQRDVPEGQKPYNATTGHNEPHMNQSMGYGKASGVRNVS